MSERKLIITTDSTSDLPQEYYEKHNIPVIPLHYLVNGVLYGEEKTLPVTDFYAKMRNNAEVSTSSTNPEYIQKVFTDLINEGYDIIHISISSGLSCSYNNALFISKDLMEEYPEARIAVVDSLCASGGEGLLLYYCVKLLEEGKNMDTILKWVDDNKLHICHQFTVESLHYLQKGGRISKSVAILGSLINVKPVLHVDNNGHLISLSNVRGRKKSLVTLVDNMEKATKDINNEIVIITHCDALEDAYIVRDMIKERFGITKFIFNCICPTIGAHSGPGTIALFHLGTSR